MILPLILIFSLLFLLSYQTSLPPLGSSDHCIVSLTISFTHNSLLLTSIHFSATVQPAGTIFASSYLWIGFRSNSWTHQCCVQSSEYFCFQILSPLIMWPHHAFESPSVSLLVPLIHCWLHRFVQVRSRYSSSIHRAKECFVRRKVECLSSLSTDSWTF